MPSARDRWVTDSIYRTAHGMCLLPCAAARHCSAATTYWLLSPKILCVLSSDWSDLLCNQELIRKIERNPKTDREKLETVKCWRSGGTIGRTKIVRKRIKCHPRIRTLTIFSTELVGRSAHHHWDRPFGGRHASPLPSFFAPAALEKSSSVTSK